MVAMAPWTSGDASMDDAVLYVCDYAVQSVYAIVQYLPVVSGAVKVGGDDYPDWTSCLEYPGELMSPRCKNLRSGQCERRMCYNLENLIQKSWFNPMSSEIPSSRGLEMLRIYRPFNYESCYVVSKDNKPVLQHKDQCTVECRVNNGFDGSDVSTYECSGALGIFQYLDTKIQCTRKTCDA